MFEKWAEILTLGLDFLLSLSVAQLDSCQPKLGTQLQVEHWLSMPMIMDTIPSTTK